MAGSRREAVGSILKRLQGLLRSGAMKEEDRPIWYDVVKAIPPKPLPPPRQVQKILYPEDFVRVQFHKVYNHTGVTSLTDKSSKSVAERFVDSYMELHKQQVVPPEDVFEHTAQKLQEKGIKLMRHGEEPPAKTVPSQPLTSEKKDSTTTTTTTTSTLDIDSLFNGKS